MRRAGRIDPLAVLDERLRDEPGRTLADLMRRFGAEGEDSTKPRTPPSTGSNAA